MRGAHLSFQLPGRLRQEDGRLESSLPPSVSQTTGLRRLARWQSAGLTSARPGGKCRDARCGGALTSIPRHARNAEETPIPRQGTAVIGPAGRNAQARPRGGKGDFAAVGERDQDRQKAGLETAAPAVPARASSPAARASRCRDAHATVLRPAADDRAQKRIPRSEALAWRRESFLR